MKLRVLLILMSVLLLCFDSCKREEGGPSDPAIQNFNPESGSTGTAVAISGHNFSSASGDVEVKFNGVLATVTTSNPSMIQTSVPEGATTGPITVTMRGGTAASAKPFTVLPQVADDLSF